LGVQTISPALATGLQLSRNSGVIISDVFPGSPSEAAGLRIQDIVVSVDGQPVDDLPFFAFHLLTHDIGDKIHMEVLRGSNRLSFDVPVMERPHQIDQIASAVDPEKNIVRPLGVLAIEVDRQIASQLPDLRDPFGILVVARSAEATSEVPLSTGDVIRTLNGVRVTTLDGLRSALQAIQPGASVVLQIQREDRLIYVYFTLDQP
jgi:serine protease Do